MPLVSEFTRNIVLCWYYLFRHLLHKVKNEGSSKVTCLPVIYFYTLHTMQFKPCLYLQVSIHITERFIDSSQKYWNKNINLPRRNKTVHIYDLNVKTTHTKQNLQMTLIPVVRYINTLRGKNLIGWRNRLSLEEFKLYLTSSTTDYRTLHSSTTIT